MLVLSRKKEESIRIGDDVVVTVVRTGPNACRIGITAPKNVKIVRSELVEPEEQRDPAVVVVV